MLLRCQALTHTDTRTVRPLCVAVFREYGLPNAIRTDNGPPFASVGIGGLSELSVWWTKLGIRPDRITPGRPQENRRHKRMHRTLKLDAATPPHNDLKAQRDSRAPTTRRQILVSALRSGLGYQLSPLAERSVPY